MNKTITINISGLVFNIDEDAYEKLKTYLTKISTHFNKEKDGREIISDIESRIAEIFSNNLSEEKKVIDSVLIEKVIETIGLPEDFSGFSEEEPATAPKQEQHNYYEKQKRLYRDPDSMVIGGVCSGLSHYFNMDKALVRILFILLFIFTSGIALPVYIILWIAVPKAKTTTQFFEMKGENTNYTENIGQKAKEPQPEFRGTDQPNYDSQNNKQHASEQKTENAGAFSKIIGFILIAFGFLSFLGLIVGVVSMSKFIGLLPGLFDSTDQYHIFNQIFSTNFSSTIIISLLIICGIPLLLIIYFGTKLMFDFVSNNRSVFLSALGVWVIGIIIAISSIAGAVNVFSTSATESSSNNLALPSDTIYIKLDKDNYESYTQKARMNNLRLIDTGKKEMLVASPKFSVEKSRGNYIDLTINKYSKGNNYRSARNNASKIEYNFSVSGDTLLLEPHFEFGDKGKWRSQNIEITLNIPEGKVIYLDNNMLPVIHKIDNVSDIWEGDMAGKFFEMKQEGLTLLK